MLFAGLADIEHIVTSAVDKLFNRRGDGRQETSERRMLIEPRYIFFLCIIHQRVTWPAVFLSRFIQSSILPCYPPIMLASFPVSQNVPEVITGHIHPSRQHYPIRQWREPWKTSKGGIWRAAFLADLKKQEHVLWLSTEWKSFTAGGQNFRTR